STSEPLTLVSHPELASRKSFPFFETVGEKPKNALEKFLSLFADVRAGAGVSAALHTVNASLFSAASSLLKVAREHLVLTESTAIVKVQASAAQAVLLLGIVPVF